MMHKKHLFFVGVIILVMTNFYACGFYSLSGISIENEETIRRQKVRNEWAQKALEFEKWKLLKMEGNTSAILDLLSNSKFPEMKRGLLDYYLQTENYAQANVVLNDLGSDGDAYYDMMNIVITCQQQERSLRELTGEEVAFLEEQAAEFRNPLHTEANLLLSFRNSELYILPSVGSASLGKRPFVPDETEIMEDLVEIVPNPADEFISIRTQLVESAVLTVFDQTGRMMTQQTIDKGYIVSEIEVFDWVNGLYTYELKSINNTLGYGKFIVQH